MSVWFAAITAALCLREREEVKSIESGLRMLVVRSSERSSKDRTNGDAKTTKPPVTALIRHRH